MEKRSKDLWVREFSVKGRPKMTVQEAELAALRKKLKDAEMEREFLERSAQVFEGDKKQTEEIERLELEQRVAHERIGRLTIENEFFKQNWDHGHPRKESVD